MCTIPCTDKRNIFLTPHHNKQKQVNLLDGWWHLLAPEANVQAFRDSEKLSRIVPKGHSADINGDSLHWLLVLVGSRQSDPVCWR